MSGLDVLVAADLRKAGFARAGHMALGQLRGVANPTKKKGGGGRRMTEAFFIDRTNATK